MGRPSGFDRDTAIETAMQEMWRNGYDACSVKAMSETLGITRSSFYNSFGSREDLFREVLDVYFEQSPDRALQGDPLEDSVLRLICRTFRAICAARANDPDARGCLAINSLAVPGGAGPLPGALIADLVVQNVARLEGLLVLAVARGELPEQSDVHAKALALQNLKIGLNILCKAVRDEDELWLTARTTLEGLGLYREFRNA